MDRIFKDNMFSVREVPWHRKGHVLMDYPGRDEAMKLAGHDFAVLERPVFADTGDGRVELKGYKVLYRDDTRAILNVVRDSYVVVQNAVVWDIVDALVDQPKVHYETAGTLNGGALLWVLAKVDEPLQVPGDDSPIYPWVMVSTAHDGTASLRAVRISVRVVCWNTYTAGLAEADRTGQTYTWKHTTNVMDRIDSAKRAIALARKDNEDFLHLAEELANVHLSESQVKDFFRRFIPEPPANVITDRVRANIDVARSKVELILDGETVPVAHKRTAYGTFLAATEYLDHVRRYNSEDTYFNRCMRSGFELKGQVAKLALAVAE